jgi:glycosyltransferase involved in cell wall biosynthesis
MTTNTNTTKINSTEGIAIAHKDYDVRGGGERLAEELARVFDAPLHVGRRNTENEPNEMADRLEEIDFGPLPDRLAKWAIDRGGATRSAAYQLVWQQQDELTEYDTVITSGNEPLWWVPEDDQTVIAYTHSTPRWQYDLFHDVDDGLLSVGYNYASRVLYQHNVTRPDLFVANSDLVARRIRQYWNIPEDQIRVVYPPVHTHKYSPETAGTEDWYFHLGRLTRHKRIDEVIRAFNQLGPDYPLKIAGKGPDRERLEAMADDHIEFLGYVSEDRKHELMSAAKAHIYPALNEDFGMVPVESMAAGTPVIGVAEGFTQFQLMDGKNGLTFPREGGHLRERVRQFERDGVAWSEQRIKEFAERFSVQQFHEGMEAAVEEAQERARVQPDWMLETEEDAVAESGVTGGPTTVRSDGGTIHDH